MTGLRLLMKLLVTLSLAALSLIVGAPLAILSILALIDPLNAWSYRESAAAGLLGLGGSVGIWTVSALWLDWCAGRSARWRFSTRRLLVGVTLATLYVGAIRILLIP